MQAAQTSIARPVMRCEPTCSEIHFIVWQVRKEAYQALAAYPMATLEAIEALRPLRDYVALLLAEPDAGARPPAELLASQALAFEHVNRRRYERSLVTLSEYWLPILSI